MLWLSKIFINPNYKQTKTSWLQWNLMWKMHQFKNEIYLLKFVTKSLMLCITSIIWIGKNEWLLAMKKIFKQILENNLIWKKKWKNFHPLEITSDNVMFLFSEQKHLCYKEKILISCYRTLVTICSVWNKN